MSNFGQRMRLLGEQQTTNIQAHSDLTGRAAQHAEADEFLEAADCLRRAAEFSEVVTECTRKQASLLQEIHIFKSAIEVMEKKGRKHD